MRAPPLLAGFVALLACACRDAPPLVSYAYDATLTERLTPRDPAWPSACGRAPDERIGLPEALTRERSPLPVSPGFGADLAAAIDSLPRPFDRLFERHVCAVVLMHGAPMSGTLRTIAGDPSHALVFFDVKALDRSANAWMAFKESSAFQLTEGRSLRGELMAPRDDSRRALLEFVLVHELAHVADSTHLYDEWIEPFRQLSWPRGDALAKTPIVHYPERKSLPPLPASLLEPYFELMATGAFASPATLSNAEEDFADSVATYVHTVIRGRPWRLGLYQSGELVRQLNTCWDEPRCGPKRALIERLLRRWGGKDGE
ncbi:MAG TPA: hypothetical protein VMG12_38320 [Polyangiaceae bacterium]|nr:hypothetical protein [Polyangiaceae bacterium]